MRWALVTGSNSGIGLAFARELAQRGWSLLLTARDIHRLQAVLESLQTAFPNQRYAALALDLTEPGAIQRLYNWVVTQTQTLGMLVNNAGVGSFGFFPRLSIDRELGMVDLNVRALTEITYRFLPILERGRPAVIILVGSVAGCFPIPFMATYAATKTYVERLGLALAYELRPRGIQVYVLAPGHTHTPFHERAGVPTGRPRVAGATPEEVVRYCLDQIERRPHRPWIVPGMVNRWLIRIARFMPVQWWNRTVGNLYRPHALSAVRQTPTSSPETSGER